MLPRPGFRVPLWSVFVVLGLAYCVRAILRGGDWAPDLPTDLVVLGLAVIAVALVGLARSADARQDAEESVGAPLNQRDDAPTDSKSDVRD